MASLRLSPEDRRPSSMLDHLQREMNRLFSDAWGTGATTAVPFPALNLSEDDKNLYLRCELPGVQIGDLSISVEGEVLTIEGVKKAVPGGEQASYHRRERELGTFRRAFTLPEKIHADAIEATLKDGLLTITLPKAPEEQPRQIRVQMG